MPARPAEELKLEPAPAACHNSPMSVNAEQREAAIWRRVIRPGAPGWSRAAAEAILALDFQPDDHERMLLLLEQAKSGNLTPDEAAELENYRQVGTTLELLQSRARLSIKNPAAS